MPTLVELALWAFLSDYLSEVEGDMRVLRGIVGCAFLISSLGLVAAGCRDQAYSGEPYPEDLGGGGEGDMVLMPVAVRSYTPHSKFEATAELLPLSDNPQDRADEGPAIAAVRDLITIFNEIVAEKEYDELPAFYVERQRESVGKLVKLVGQMEAKVDALAAAVQDKAPESAIRVTQLRDEMAKQDLTMEVSDLTEVSDTEVTAQTILSEGTPVIPGTDLSIKFLLIDDEWYIQQPLMDMMAAMLPMMTQMLTTLDGMIDGINSGEMDAEAIDQQLKQIMAMISADQDSGDEPTSPSEPRP